MKNNGTMKESVVHSIAQIKNYFFMLKILTYESDTFLQSLNYYLLRLLIKILHFMILLTQRVAKFVCFIL